MPGNENAEMLKWGGGADQDASQVMGEQRVMLGGGGKGAGRGRQGVGGGTGCMPVNGKAEIWAGGLGLEQDAYQVLEKRNVCRQQLVSQTVSVGILAHTPCAY